MDSWAELYKRCKNKVLSRKVYIIEALRDGMLTSSPAQGTSEISIFKERSHIAKAHLKLIR